jgi:hypothetical protein
MVICHTHCGRDGGHEGGAEDVAGKEGAGGHEEGAEDVAGKEKAGGHEADPEADMWDGGS